jgi:hypothetical protein
MKMYVLAHSSGTHCVYQRVTHSRYISRNVRGHFYKLHVSRERYAPIRAALSHNHNTSALDN